MGTESSTCADVSSVDGATTSETVATTPLAIAMLLSPQRTQVDEPGVLVHETDLPAPAATDPGVTVAEEKSVAG
jgi:hypothetical protein